MTKIAKFVGLDVHKDTIAIAYCEGGPLVEPIQVGTVPSDIPRVIKALDKLGPRESLRVCYEAGPTGYGLCRALLSAGIECIVVAPGKVPKDPGRRVKTDARDARDLARLLRTGYLQGITLPDAGSVPDEIAALAARRQAARAARNFAEADRIRAELAARGYTVEDTSNGPFVRRKS